MKFYTILLSLFLFSLPVQAQKQANGVVYDTKILRVTDGDTVVIAAPFLPAPLKPELAVRIYGIDTPEKGHRAQCPLEAQQGENASKFTKSMIANGRRFQVVLFGWDKYGGRVLGDILIDGQSLRHGLIINKLAREYYGDAKSSWCS